MKWKSVCLGEIARAFISGGTPDTKASEFWTGRVPWITGADVVDGKVNLGRRFISESAVQNSAANIVPKGSVLLVTRTGVGKIAIAQDDIAISQDLTGIVVKDGFVPTFVMWAILGQISSLISVQRGATIKGVLRTDVARLPIPFTGISEQRRIVELLEQADGLRRKRTEADALADRILPAVFRKMFGDPNRRYNPVPFSSLVREFCYGTSNRSEDQGRPALRIPNVVGEDLDLSVLKLVPVTDDEFSRLQLLEGDMLFVRTNGNPDYVGRCAVFGNYAVRESGFPVDEFVFASYLIRARLKPAHANPYFIKQYLQSPGGRAALRERSRTSAGQFNINTEGLGSLPIPLPPLSEQKRFAFFVLSMRRLRLQWQSSQERIDQIFATMLHRAFTGELTAKWREAHLKELLAEMEQQARLLKSPLEE